MAKTDTKTNDWFVYLIEAENGHLYTGITTDVDRRFQEHLQGKKGAQFFKISPAKQLVYSELQADRSSASKREYAIKNLSRTEKLALIKTPV
jgi:putative endonuclease